MIDSVNFPFASQAHGHTALHMAAGLHRNPHQEDILQLLLRRGADPSIRNLENDQPAHLLQSGHQGEQVGCLTLGVSPCRFFNQMYSTSASNFGSFAAQAHAEETKCIVSSAYCVLTGPGLIWTTCNPIWRECVLNKLPLLTRGFIVTWFWESLAYNLITN